jgi:tetratricopeptide (TPR) repeat protein
MKSPSRLLAACALLLALALLGSPPTSAATPYVPSADDQVLALLPAGARHASVPLALSAADRLDVALPLAQFEIGRARASGDLRFLGYAEAILTPWLKRANVDPQALVMHATILQSRHDFLTSLSELDRALALNPKNAQAWLTRATVLRVLGRFDEAKDACTHLADTAAPAITRLCAESLRGLTGNLADSYGAIRLVAPVELSPEARAWRYSELGEMAERLGDDAAAEHWFREGLQVSPQDLYMRIACADLLLRNHRPQEVITLLGGYESMEPMLLRLVLAHRELHDDQSASGEASLANAFALELQRGDAVHRREQARFLLDVEHDPAAALTAAQANWQVQKEPDDILILVRAAQAAHRPESAAQALEFLKRTGLQDSRLASESAARSRSAS